MPRFVSIRRIRRAILNLVEWRDRVDSQGAQHLWSLLALKQKGVNTGDWTRFEESDDKAFCDNVLWVEDSNNQYYDPVSGQFRIKTHYHSNIA